MNEPAGRLVRERTTAAVLTAGGRGAIAVVRLCGDWTVIERTEPPLFRSANGRRLAEQQTGRVVYGRWGQEPPEEVVLCRIDDRTLEIHCHGGRAAPQRVLNDLLRRGVVVESSREQSVARDGPFVAECRDALSRTRTLRTAEIVLEQCEGVLEQSLRKLLQAVLSAEVPPAQWLAALDAVLHRAEFGRHLTRPWRVVVSGRPNVGKSSLINALVGYGRSIVFDQPGTTRDVVTSETALDGWPVEFVDTAGIRETTEQLESAGIERARSALQGADLRLLLLDVSRPPTDEDHRLLDVVREPIVVLHKCDLPAVWSPATVIPRLRLSRHDSPAVSSLTGEGIPDLQRAIVESLVPETPPPGTPIPLTERQIRLLREARSAAADRATAAQKLREILDGAPEAGLQSASSAASFAERMNDERETEEAK